MNNTFIKISTFVSYALMILVNYLAVALPLGGRNTGAISDYYPNLFAPAGYAFSIWGIIYIMLGIYVIYQLKQGRNNIITRVNRIFIINALLNALWIFAWHYNLIGISVVIMIGLLFTLIRIADILRISNLTQKEKWLVRLPFSVYFGWITVATIANITIFLVSLGFNNGLGLSNVFWTILILLVGAIIGSWRMIYDRFIPYGLVLIWAYGAILAKHVSVTGFGGEYPSIIWTAVLCILIFLGTITLISINKKVK